MCLRREWDIRNSLIAAFATFILLSYMKILNTSIDLLAPVTLYSNVVSQLYLNIDGTIEYSVGEEHRPYAILAIVMITLFNSYPIAFLLLYPFACFQKLLFYGRIQHPVHGCLSRWS